MIGGQLKDRKIPVVGVLGWLLFGPRGRTDPRIVAWSIVFPLLWLVFTLIRGEFVGFYPYPFVNVTEHGYPRVLLNCLLVAILFLALEAGATDLDSRLRPVRAMVVAQQISQQAKVLAAAREIGWVEVDYDRLRGIEPLIPTLFSI